MSQMFKGPDGAFYSTERDASMAYAWQRWEKHGNRQFCIWLVGGREVFLLCERISVSGDGALLVYTKFKDEPEFLSGSYAPGTWRSFWVLSAIDGCRSHIIDDTSWWQSKSVAGSVGREREREKVTPRRRLRILQRDNFTCKLCGRGPSDGVSLHIDHVLAISLGGKSTDDNLQVLCMDCNLGKGVESLVLGAPKQGDV